VSEFIIGAAVATYACVLVYFLSDIVKSKHTPWWYWPAVLLWPVVLPLAPLTRYVYKRVRYEYRDDPRWGKGWYTKRSRIHD
jgi:hypothetical protein